MTRQRLLVVASTLVASAPVGPVAPVTSIAPASPVTAIDPVCHMTVTIATARHVGTWDGRTWYFCNPRCKDKFLADPARYLAPDDASASSSPGTGAAR